MAGMPSIGGHSPQNIILFISNVCPEVLTYLAYIQLVARFLWDKYHYI